MAKPRTCVQWAARIKAMHKQTVHAFLKLGRTLLAAKKALPHGEFLKMIEHDLPFTASTAQRLMKIADDLKLANAARVRLLPAAWGTLYELTKVPEKPFAQAITSGAVHPAMTRQDAIRLVTVSAADKPPHTRALSLPPELRPEVLEALPLDQLAMAERLEKIATDLTALSVQGRLATAIEKRVRAVANKLLALVARAGALQ
jgi:hypothetical protein